jgi:hypothetical protein
MFTVHNVLALRVYNCSLPRNRQEDLAAETRSSAGATTHRHPAGTFFVLGAHLASPQDFLPHLPAENNRVLAAAWCAKVPTAHQDFRTALYIDVSAPPIRTLHSLQTLQTHLLRQRTFANGRFSRHCQRSDCVAPWGTAPYASTKHLTWCVHRLLSCRVKSAVTSRVHCTCVGMSPACVFSSSAADTDQLLPFTLSTRWVAFRSIANTSLEH